MFDGWLLICPRCVAGREVKTIGIMRDAHACEHCGTPMDPKDASPWEASRREELFTRGMIRRTR